MTIRRFRLLSITLTVVGALLFAGCGDDDTDSATEATDDAAGSEDLGDDFSVEGECAFLGEFARGVDEAFDTEEALRGGEAVDFGAIFRPLAEEIDDVAAAAPDEIQGDFEIVADGFEQAATALEGVVIDMSDPESFDPEALAELETLEDTFGGEFEAAAERIDVWISENCPAE